MVSIPIGKKNHFLPDVWNFPQPLWQATAIAKDTNEPLGGELSGVIFLGGPAYAGSFVRLTLERWKMENLWKSHFFGLV